MNVAEIAQIRIHIQGQPVHSDIMTTPHSYRANLTGTRRITFQPDTRRFLQTSRFNAIRCADTIKTVFIKTKVRNKKKMRTFVGPI
mgnify:CR=1 FL=1